MAAFLEEEKNRKIGLNNDIVNIIFVGRTQKYL
jgi:hypothetical protein